VVFGQLEFTQVYLYENMLCPDFESNKILYLVDIIGLRIEGALQYMAYEKMLKLRNGGEAVLSQCITFCTNEQERIFECVFSGVLAIGEYNSTHL